MYSPLIKNILKSSILQKMNKIIFTVEGKGGDRSVDKFSFFSIFSLLLETFSRSLSEFVSLYSSSS